LSKNFLATPLIIRLYHHINFSTFLSIITILR
jgi:hypothetical protein